LNYAAKKKSNSFEVAFFVIPSGFEPETYCLEGSCSIQLSYETIFNKKWKFFNFHLSGWQDSNLRPPAPKAGAITGLRYTPKVLFLCGETGIRTLASVTR
jgi:hypothetical protein